MLREKYNSNKLEEVKAGNTDQLPGGRQRFAQHVSHITQQVSTDYTHFDIEVHLFISKYDILLTKVTLGEW